MRDLPVGISRDRYFLPSLPKSPGLVSRASGTFIYQLLGPPADCTALVLRQIVSAALT